MFDEATTYEELFSRTMSRRIKIKRPIHSAQTPFQKVTVVDTYDYGVTLFLDNYFQTSERDEFFYHEPLVHPAMLSHPDPRKVLVIGGGDGGTLEEVTRYNTVETVRMVELDGEVVKIAREHLRAVCGNAFEDERAELVIGDGRKYVEETSERFDVIILDLTDPLEPSKYVYTKEFYELCKNRLRENGILALHNDSPFFCSKAFNVISKTLDSVFPHKLQHIGYVVGYMLDFAFAVCSREPLPSLSEEELERRLTERGVGELLYYTPRLHTGMGALPGYARKILESPCDISTDAAPYVLEL